MISVLVVSRTESARFIPKRYIVSMEGTFEIPHDSQAYTKVDLTQASRTFNFIFSGAEKFFLRKLLYL